MSIHDFPSKGKSFLGTLFCKPAIDKLSTVNIFPYQHNHLKRDNCFLGETCRDQIIATSRDTDRECRLSLYNGCTAYFKWSLEFEKNRLLHEYFLAFHTQCLNFSFEEINLFRYFRRAHWEKFINDIVYVDLNFSLHIYQWTYKYLNMIFFSHLFIIIIWSFI